MNVMLLFIKMRLEAYYWTTKTNITHQLLFEILHSYYEGCSSSSIHL